MMTDSKRIFTDIYERKLWGEGSGGGSSPEAAAPYVLAVNEIIREMKPRTILDLGCGDGWVASRFDLGGALYIGVDVVDSVIDCCREHHSWGEFRCLDILTDPLPEADLVLCKEVMQHLTWADCHALAMKLRSYPVIFQCSVNTEGLDIMRAGGTHSASLEWFVGPTILCGYWSYGGTSYFMELWRPHAL